MRSKNYSVERWMMRASLLVLALGACTTTSMNPENDDWVEQRIARHPEPWVLFPPDSSITDDKELNSYFVKNLEGRYFFLSKDAFTPVASGRASANDGFPESCVATGKAGKKEYSLCAIRHNKKIDQSRRQLRGQCGGGSKMLGAQRNVLHVAEECNDIARKLGANFFSFDQEERVCVAVSICAINKATIERDVLWIDLAEDGEIGAAVATGGPRPM
jgi:hypothetical protein